jgi:hypothetical protein
MIAPEVMIAPEMIDGLCRIADVGSDAHHLYFGGDALSFLQEGLVVECVDDEHGE